MKRKLLAIVLAACMVLSIVPAALAATVTFQDVSTDSWFFNEVNYVYKNGLMNGVGNDLFAPTNSVSRAMVWTTMARIDGVDTTGSSPWYEAGRKWAMKQDVSDGTGALNNVTREQLVTMLYRYLGSPKVTSAEYAALKTYADAASVSAWAKDAVAWALEAGILHGADGKLNPTGDATRAELAVILYRYMEQVLKTDIKPEGNQKPSAVPHVHTFGKWETNYDGTHFHACRCGATASAECVYLLSDTCMFCGYNRAAAAAIGDTYYDTFEEALAVGGEITLLADASISSVVTVSGNLVLNLNGYDLDCSANTSRPFEMADGASLTINGAGSTILYGAYGLVNIPANNSADITLNGGTYEGEMDFGSFLKPRGNGAITISLTDVTLSDASDDSYLMDASSYTGSDLSVSISGGSFSAAHGISMGGGQLTMRDAALSVDYVGVEIGDGGTASISGCTITVDGTAFSNAAPNACIAASGPDGRAEGINGGKVTVTDSALTSNFHVLTIYSNDSSSITATGCTINHSGSYDPYKVYADNGTITVDGAIPVVTVDALVDALAEGGKVTLQKDLALSNVISVSEDTVLDLNGHDLDLSANASRPFELADGASLTINGAGSTVKYGKYGLVNIPAGNSGSITLNGGTYEGEMDYGSFLKPRGNGSITISLTDVTLSDASDDSYLMDASSYTGSDLSVSISGGSFSAAGGISMGGGQLTMSDAALSVDYVGVEIGDGGTASISGCTITVDGTAFSNAAPNACIAASGPAGKVEGINGGKVTVADSTLTSNFHVLTIYSNDSSAITATGCTINHSGSYDAYKIYENNGTITVDGVNVLNP